MARRIGGINTGNDRKENEKHCHIRQVTCVSQTPDLVRLKAISQLSNVLCQFTLFPETLYSHHFAPFALSDSMG